VLKLKFTIMRRHLSHLICITFEEPPRRPSYGRSEEESYERPKYERHDDDKDEGERRKYGYGEEDEEGYGRKKHVSISVLQSPFPFIYVYFGTIIYNHLYSSLLSFFPIDYVSLV
jgi:hypothetical protein